MGFYKQISVIFNNATKDQVEVFAEKMKPVFAEHLDGKEWVITYASEKKNLIVQGLGDSGTGLWDTTVFMATVLGVIDNERDWSNNMALKHLLKQGLEEATEIPVLVV